MKDCIKLQKDEVFLFHAAAGGVGLIASQWAKSIGAKMIGTVSTDEKASLAKKMDVNSQLIINKRMFIVMF